jgi:hypothetical protein
MVFYHLNETRSLDAPERTQTWRGTARGGRDWAWGSDGRDWAWGSDGRDWAWGSDRR